MLKILDRPIFCFVIIELLYAIVRCNAANAVVDQDVLGVPSGIAYYVQIVIGSPVYSASNPNASSKNTFNMLIDTGSSNEAVITRQCCSSVVTNFYDCASSSTCSPTNTQVGVQYISGSWSGTLVADTFSGPQLGAFPKTSFVMILQQKDFVQSGYDGILGLAYDAIAQPSSNPPPTFFQSMVNSGATPNIFSMQLCGYLQPLTQGLSVMPHSGQWLIGGTEGKKGEKYYSGDVMYTPLIQEKWYVVIITDIGFGNDSIGIDCQTLNSPQAIIDSGTSNIALPSDAYKAVMAKIKAATLAAIPNFSPTAFIQDTPCCTTVCNPSNTNSPLLKLPSISFSFGFDDGSNTKQQFTVTVPPTYYWRPVIAGQGTNCRMLGISESDGLVLGDVFMDGLFVVHDRDQKKIGISVASNCANNAKSSKTVSVQSSSSDWCDCFSTQERHDSILVSLWPGKSRCFFWFWWMYFVIVCAIIVFLSLAYVIFVYIRATLAKRRQRMARQRSLNELGTNLLTPGPRGVNQSGLAMFGGANANGANALPVATSVQEGDLSRRASVPVAMPVTSTRQSQGDNLRNTVPSMVNQSSRSPPQMPPPVPFAPSAPSSSPSSNRV